MAAAYQIAGAQVDAGRRGVTPMVNALTIDFEDWFQVTSLERFIGYPAWSGCEVRLHESTERLLRLLGETETRATFFVLGWEADHFPDLVKRILEAGHEIGSHGYRHQVVYSLSPDQFREDLERSMEAIARAAGRPPVGYRAPSFSIVGRSAWALEVLKRFGLEFDSSVVPARHHRYGIPHAPRYPYRILLNGSGALAEGPISTLAMAGTNLIISGGAYFRLLAYPIIRSAVRWLNGLGQPAVFYLHPWELDPGIPRYPLPTGLRILSYANLHTTEDKLRRLLREFRFAPLGEVIRDRSVVLPSVPVEFLARTSDPCMISPPGVGDAMPTAGA